MVDSLLDRAAQDLRTARQALDACMLRAREVAIEAIDQGTSEAETAQRLGVNRMTVRRWLGKL